MRRIPLPSTFAVDFVVTRDEPDLGELRADLKVSDVLSFETLDERDGVAILQEVPVRVSDIASDGWVLVEVPFMAARDALQGS